MLVKLVLSAAATLLVYGLYKLVVVVLGQLNSPLRDLPGPKSPSWIYGNFAEIIAAVRTIAHPPSKVVEITAFIPSDKPQAPRGLGAAVWLYHILQRIPQCERYPILKVVFVSGTDFRITRSVDFTRPISRH
jgi:hypothetical protein